MVIETIFGADTWSTTPIITQNFIFKKYSTLINLVLNIPLNVFSFINAKHVRLIGKL